MTSKLATFWGLYIPKITEQVKTLNTPLCVLPKTEDDLNTVAFKACPSLNINAGGDSRHPRLGAVASHSQLPALSLPTVELEGSLAPSPFSGSSPRCAHLPGPCVIQRPGWHRITEARLLASILPPHPTPPRRRLSHPATSLCRCCGAGGGSIWALDFLAPHSSVPSSWAPSFVWLGVADYLLSLSASSGFLFRNA